MSLELAFVAGLSDKKLAQKLRPLQELPEVKRIDLYRRQPFGGPKVRWMGAPRLAGHTLIGELYRVGRLLRHAGCYDAIIGCHQRFHGLYAALAGALRGVPVVQMTITDPAWMERVPFGRRALRSAAAVAFRGRTTLERHRRLYGDHQALFALPNAWAPPELLTTVEKTFDVLYVGYLAAYKNMPAWLEAVAEVRRHRPELSAALVGERPGPRFLSQARRLGLNDRVLKAHGTLRGDALQRVYASSRVLLLASRWEGLPQVALEAMAQGVPVVATDVGDTRDLVRSGENGALVEVDDVAGAARAVLDLLEGSDAYHRASRAARASAERYAADATPERLSAEWRRVLHEIDLLPGGG